MSLQEAALYGDLVVALRDYTAEQLAAGAHDLDAEAAGRRLDEFIRTWFFTPQAALYGSAPREVIWREQLDEGNLIPKEYAIKAYGDCDCPICQMLREEIENAESDEAHGHYWTYNPDSCLLDRYDPEGSDARWRKELEAMQGGQEERTAPAAASAPAPATPEQSWPEAELRRAAQQLVERCDVPMLPPHDPPYRRITWPEAVSLLTGLHAQGVDTQAVLAQIDAWPYLNVALDWLSEPEQALAVIEWALRDEASPQPAIDVARYRDHRAFITALAQLMPPAARLWLSGWLAAVRRTGDPHDRSA